LCGREPTPADPAASDRRPGGDPTPHGS
jgi:hypothetical protein